MERFIGRAEVLDEAGTLPLPDAIFGMVYFNAVNWTSGPRKQCDPITIEELGLVCEPAVLADWQARAAAMFHRGMGPGDACLRKDGSYERVKQKFIADHPGFGHISYDRAIGYGIHVMR